MILLILPYLMFNMSSTVMSNTKAAPHSVPRVGVEHHRVFMFTMSPCLTLWCSTPTFTPTRCHTDAVSDVFNLVYTEISLKSMFISTRQRALLLTHVPRVSHVWLFLCCCWWSFNMQETVAFLTLHFCSIVLGVSPTVCCSVLLLLGLKTP